MVHLQEINFVIFSALWATCSGVETPSPSPSPQFYSGPLYHGWTSPVAGCSTSGYNAVAATPLGGTFPYYLSDSAACQAWKLAATVCMDMPANYAGTENFQCNMSGGFTDTTFGTYCAYSGTQYSCSTCPGFCNAGSGCLGGNTLRNCNDAEVVVAVTAGSPAASPPPQIYSAGSPYPVYSAGSPAASPVPQFYSGPLYHNRTSPVANCSTSGYNAVGATPLGGTYPYYLSDSAACKAWKLAATVCMDMPTDYYDLTNFQCSMSGGFTDVIFGTYCSYSGTQYSCSTCPGLCNAGTGCLGGNTLRGCLGSEIVVAGTVPSPASPVPQVYSGPLYHGLTSPVPNCSTNGYNAVAVTPLGGTYPYYLSDSASCQAWKLAATVCMDTPTTYYDLTNFQCSMAGGFTDATFGTYCAYSGTQYSCSTCPGACNAGADCLGGNTLRDCFGFEYVVLGTGNSTGGVTILPPSVAPAASPNRSSSPSPSPSPQTIAPAASPNQTSVMPAASTSPKPVMISMSPSPSPGMIKTNAAAGRGSPLLFVLSLALFLLTVASTE